ncbi:MAG: sigma-54 dependent transcriptional regulator [Pseudomonadota bacterium]
MSKDILIVDDEQDIRELIAGVYEDEGYQVRSAATSAEALFEMRSRTPGLVVLDVWLQGSDMDGLTVLKHMKSIDPEMPVIVISGHGNIETAVAAIRRGAYDFIEKPFKSAKLLHLTERALEAALLKRENKALRGTSGKTSQWIGSSQAASNLHTSIEKVATTNSRVLITGEAGSGKELCAQLIHKMSNRAGNPFVAINAANIVAENIERELFGEENADGLPIKVGVFERAHGGTLLLDEVGEMPLASQSKILRLLTEQRFQRVNGKADVKVDVRVMSTSTKDLSEAIEAETFRKDLYYRLNVVPIHVPSLQDRREDIPELVEFFSQSIAENSGLTPRQFSQEALAILQSMSWPGNVRQLKNLVERVLILSRGAEQGAIGIKDLPIDNHNRGKSANGSMPTELVGLSLRDAREHFEREYLTLQITRFDGNISRTAEFIGMERSALHRKLKALGVSTSQSRAESA